jgi:hypothetical protein
MDMKTMACICVRPSQSPQVKNPHPQNPACDCRVLLEDISQRQVVQNYLSITYEDNQLFFGDILGSIRQQNSAKLKETK